MKKIIKIIAIVLVALIVLLFLIFIAFYTYSDITKTPTGDRFISGRVSGNIIELMNSTFRYKTFDSDGKIIRDDNLDIYACRKFKIEFLMPEKYFLIYRSSYTYQEGKYKVSKYIDVEIANNNAISTDDYNRRYFVYFLDADILKYKK